MALCPLLVIFYWISLSSFHGSLSEAYNSMSESGPANFFSQYAPRPSLEASVGYGVWLMFQAALYQFLPSVLSSGQLTPAGNLLKYRTNGLLAWSITHALFAAFSLHGTLDPAILARNWEGLLLVTNVYGFILTGVAYAKAHFSPSHEKDRKFSGKHAKNIWAKRSLLKKPGSVLYDLYMGIELNPRFGKYFDFKLFTNGRPGIIAWTLM
jgi:7-dehydrocholesterol reductase